MNVTTPHMEKQRTPSPPPSHRRQLTRDERARIRTLHYTAGWTYQAIVDATGFSYDQVGYAFRTGATPKKRSGRPPLLTPDQVQQVIRFVCQSKATRRMTWAWIPIALGWSD
jgi:transposase